MPQRLTGRIVAPLVLALMAAAGAVAVAPRAATGVAGLQEQRIYAYFAGLTTPIKAENDFGGSPGHDLYPAREISPDKTSDFDGDGRGDVIEMNYTGGPTTLTIRRGVDGHALWSRTDANLVGFVPLRVGKPVRPGLVVASLATGKLKNHPTTTSLLTVSALDGRTGSALWTKVFPGETRINWAAIRSAFAPSCRRRQIGSHRLSSPSCDRCRRSCGRSSCRGQMVRCAAVARRSKTSSSILLRRRGPPVTGPTSVTWIAMV